MGGRGEQEEVGDLRWHGRGHTKQPQCKASDTKKANGLSLVSTQHGLHNMWWCTTCGYNSAWCDANSHPDGGTRAQCLVLSNLKSHGRMPLFVAWMRHEDAVATKPTQDMMQDAMHKGVRPCAWMESWAQCHDSLLHQGEGA